MKTSLLQVVARSLRRSAFIVIVGCVLMGLALGRFIIISPIAGLLLLSSGVVLTLTVLVRKTDYLLGAWFVLTTLVWAIMARWLPQYYSSVGRAIFWGLLACTMAAWAIDHTLSRTRFRSLDNVPLKAIAVIFFLWAMISIGASEEVFLGVKKISHIFIAFIAGYMFYDYFAQDVTNIRKVMRIVAVLAIFVSLTAVTIGFHSVISGVPVYKRLTLWFWNPNSLGTYLFLCLPMVTATAFDLSSKAVLRVLLVGLLLLALFFSFHRTSWLSCSVALLFLILKSRLRVPVWFALVVGLFVSALLYPLVGGDVFDYVTEQRYTGRTDIWKAAWHAASDKPLLGSGPGTSVSRISEYIEIPWLRGQDTHNAYLKNAVEMGLPSLILVPVFFCTFFYYSNKIERGLKSHYLKQVTLGAVATLLGVTIYSFFENGFVLTAFDASEFTVIWPYILVFLPFAAKNLDEKAE